MQLDNNNHRNPRCTKPDEAAFALLGKMTSKSAILAVLLTFEAFAYTYSENIVRHACNSQATFFKVATNYSMNDNGKVTKTTSNSLIGCVDLCFQYPLCKAFNYKSVTTEESTCELLQKDRITSPNDIVPRGGWSFYDTGLFSTQIGQFCRNLTYNPCYPCLCIDSCYSHLGYTCNCTQGLPSLPEIYISFEKTLNGVPTQTSYDRGKDMEGNSVVTMKQGSNIGTSPGRRGKVLRITGTNAGATIGYFYNHNINNPNNAKLSISFWMRIISPYSGYQTILGTGTYSDSTGVLLRVFNHGNRLGTRSLVTTAQLRCSTPDLQGALKKWSHIVLISDWTQDRLEIFVNGRSAVKDTRRESLSVSISSTRHPHLIFGAGYFFSMANDYWNIHIDDFAIWNNQHLKKDDIIHIMNKGHVPNPL